jgi:hypothetical protein
MKNPGSRPAATAFPRTADSPGRRRSARRDCARRSPGCQRGNARAGRGPGSRKRAPLSPPRKGRTRPACRSWLGSANSDQEIERRRSYFAGGHFERDSRPPRLDADPAFGRSGKQRCIERTGSVGRRCLVCSEKVFRLRGGIGASEVGARNGGDAGSISRLAQSAAAVRIRLFASP